MSTPASEASAKLVFLDAFHRSHSARMMPFAGYSMPLQYKDGILKEHLHVRAAAGLFDVSHMGQLAIRPRSGNLADVAAALETLMPVDVCSLPMGRQRYGLFTNARGGILDDLMIAHLPGRFFVVVNASRKHEDEQHLRDSLAAQCEIECFEDRALLALQGPQAADMLAVIAPEVTAMAFMDVREMKIFGKACFLTRSGYTGEDGFEISVPASIVERFAETLFSQKQVALIGLGARDSLRLEAGLCLYGSDIDESTTPVEAALTWAIQKSRRPGGARAGGFPGEIEIFQALRDGSMRRRVGLLPEGRAPVRHGAALFRDQSSEDAIGYVTSGCFGPTVNAPVAMGYVRNDVSVGSLVFADLREKRVPVRLSQLPFVPANYQRKQN